MSDFQNKDRNTLKQTLSFHLNPNDFIPATQQEKEESDKMRESVTYWKDAIRRLKQNKLAMVSFAIIIFIFIFAFILPSFYPYSYEYQIRGSENLRPMEYSVEEQALIDSGEDVFPHFFGTDNLGRDMVIRIMIGARISVLVGLVSSALILIIGSTYGAVAGYKGGRTDMVMMRIVDMIYTIPDILIIILLSVTLKPVINKLFEIPLLKPLGLLGSGLISIFIVFTLLYWVSMARIVRGQILMLKEQEFVTAARALGARPKRIIMKHLLPNCIGTIVVTSTLQIPASIFVESFLSFLGLGVSAPMPSLGSLAAVGINGIISYPYRLFIPAIAISIVILVFNIFGDGVRDALDPKMKK